MKLLFFLPLILFCLIPQQVTVQDTAPVNVIAHKWTRARKTVEVPEGPGITPPAGAMIAQNKNFARNVRANEPPGVRDPNADTLDGRSAQMEKNVQDARQPKSKQMDGITYKVKVKNDSANLVEVLFWEYQLSDPLTPENVTRHQFICGVSIGPSKEKELEGFSTTNLSNVISVDSLSDKTKQFQEKVIVNRVEYADGVIWQRKDWSLKEVKASYERALKEAWVPGMCKSL